MTRIELILKRLEHELDELREELVDPTCTGHLASLATGEFQGIQKAIEIIKETK